MGQLNISAESINSEDNQRINVSFLGVEVKFEVPIDRNDYDLGRIVLENEGRNFALDVYQSYTNQENDTIFCDVHTDFDILSTDEYNYQLSAEDLMFGAKGTMFVGDSFEEVPQSITLFVKIGELTKAIDLAVE